MEIFSSLLPLLIIISVIVSIINKAKQGQSKSSRSTPSSSKVSSLQEIIRRQIEEQKMAVLNYQNPSAVVTPQQSKPSNPVVFGEGNYTNTDSLENTPVEMQRHSHNVHGDRPSYNEGEKLNRTTLEHTPVEMQRHSHTVHGGLAYNEGDVLNRITLEGQPSDLDVVSSVAKRASKTTKTSKHALSKSGNIDFKLNSRSVVNGIIMSEILNKRGGRRAL